MTSTDATPTLLPGVPASTWSRALAIAGYFTIPVYLGFGYFRLNEHEDDSAFNQLFLPLVIYGGLAVAAVLACTFMFGRASKREAAAGYTTQWRSQPTLPQLDARTGALVRAAGQPYVKRSDWRERTFAGGSTPTTATDVSPWERDKPGPLAALATTIPSVMIAFISIGALAGITRIGGQTIIGRIVVVLVVVVVALGLIYGIGALVVRGRLQRLRAVASGDLIFVFGKSKGYADAFVEQAIRTGPADGYVQRGVSANADGLTVWEGNPYEQVLHFRWDVITAIQIDRLTDGSVNNYVVLVTFTSHSGPLATLPLAYPKFNSFPIPSKAGTTWIVAQLNGLREHKTSPRVI